MVTPSFLQDSLSLLHTAAICLDILYSLDSHTPVCAGVWGGGDREEAGV